MMQFSGAIRVSDLNDYIAPSNACIVALNGSKISLSNEPSDQVELSKPPRSHAHAPEASTSRLHWTQAQAKDPGESIKVTLHDCLACSGCVTSAESVLLESQSGSELMERLDQARAYREFVKASASENSNGTTPSSRAPPHLRPLVVIVSISPQSKASLAAFYGTSTSEVFSRLSGWLKERGAEQVLDVEDGRGLSLIESSAEFIRRLRSRALPSQGKGEGLLPMLASSCPGWVVYAEKTQGDFVLPYLSTARSPQGMMGSLVKTVLRASLTRNIQVKGSIRDEDITLYHATIMPCFDKKLEAVRDELSITDSDGSMVPEVDCCLTTTEIQRLLVDSGVSDIRSLPFDGKGPFLHELVLGPPDSSASDMEIDAIGAGHSAQIGSRFMGSGGYYDFIFREAAREVFGIDIPSDGPLPLQPLRNSDFQEITLNAGDAQRPLLKFAICYGFRNIQSLIQKIKSEKCDYDFVEVMACPSGCLNGGGQMKSLPGESASQLLERLEAVYDSSTRLRHGLSAEQQGSAAERDNFIRRLYEVWIKGGPGSKEARSLLHTSFKKRHQQGMTNAIDF